MKQPKKLTRNQKQILTNHDLDWNNWMCVSESDFYLKVQNKSTGKILNLDKYKRKEK